MKLLAYISGAFAASLIPMGFLFKIMHWPGANILLVLGIGVLSLVFVPSFFRYKYLKK